MPDVADAPAARPDPLLARLRRGDEGAYRELLAVHGPRMLATARRLLRNDADAQDAVQEAFLAAFKALDGFAGNASLGTWLHRIVLNAALMKLRSQRRRPEEPVDPLLPRFLDGGHFAEPPRAWTQTAERVLERRETRELVRDAIDRLPETYRLVLLLRDIGELPAEETARFLEITPNNLKVRLHRARQALRTLLDPLMREDTR